MNVTPIEDRVIIERDPAAEKLGNFFLSDTAKEKPRQGIVRAVGPGAFNGAGERIPMATKVDDKVVYGEFAGTEIRIDGVEYIIVRERELLYKL